MSYVSKLVRNSRRRDVPVKDELIRVDSENPPVLLETEATISQLQDTEDYFQKLLG